METVRERWNQFVLKSSSLDAFLDVVGTLAGAEFDDPEFGQAVLDERILLDDAFDLLTVPANRQDDSPIARNLPPRDEEIPGRVILLQEPDVRGHPRVYFLEWNLVD